MRFTIVVAVVVGISSPALADGTKMTNGECLDISAALEALSGTYDKVVKETIARPNFKLKGAWSPIALNSTALAPLMKAYTDANNKIVDEVSNKTGTVKHFVDPEHQEKGETKEWRLYQERIKEFMDRPCTVELAKIKKSDIEISDDNPIPLRVYRVIEPLLE